MPSAAEERYYQYVDDVLEGRQLAPERIQHAMARTVALRDDPSVYLDTDALESFVSFAETMVIADGHTLQGKNIQLMPWQVWSLGSLVAWKYHEDGAVVHKQGWIEVARGAGKSAMVALVALWSCTYYEGGDVSILGGKQEQAGLILDSAKSFLEHSKHSLDYEIKRWEVRVGTSWIRALSAKTHTLDGLRSRLYLLDEGHEYRDDVFAKVISALPKSANAQMVSVSTPGGTDLGQESVYYRTRVVAEESLKDSSKLRSVFAALYGIDELDSIEDEDCWVKGQPGLGHVITLADYRRAFETYVAQNREGDWERYQLCRYSLRSVGWIEGHVIEASSKELNIEDFFGKRAYIGLDLSKSFDLSSMAIQFWENQQCHTFMWHWVPAKAAREGYRAHGSLIDSWGKRDFVEIVETETIDYDKIRDRLLWACENFTVDKECIGVDALGGLKPTLQDWEQNHDLPLIGIPQTITVIGPATFSFESLIREGKMTIRKDPVFEYAVNNVQMNVGQNGDRRPTKEKSTGIIDPCIAGIQATAIAIEQGAMLPPAYRTEEDIII